jgi:predicted nucleotidyltransferase
VIRVLDINQIKEAATKMAADYPIKKVMLFGSYADGTAGDASDVDLLVEFLTPTVSLFTLAGIKNEMEDTLKTKVDIIHGPLPKESRLRLNKVIDIYEQ